MTLRALPPDLEVMARTTVNEDPKRTQEDIDHIKQWLKKQPHIRARTDDQWILSFLRGCKFSLERTKEKLDTFYTCKTLLPEFFSNRDPMAPELQAILALGQYIPLEQPDSKGRFIALLRMGVYNSGKYKIVDTMRAMYLMADLKLRDDDRSLIAGEVAIMDFKGMPLDMMAQMTPSLMKKMIKVSQEAYPIRPQASHFINVPAAFETIFNLMRSMLNKKMQRRMTVHGTDLTALYEHVPREALPTEYGGNAGPIDAIAARWKAAVESNRAWFIEDEKYGTDEKKRPGKPKTSSDMFGVEGSFRNLAVD